MRTAIVDDILKRKRMRFGRDKAEFVQAFFAKQVRIFCIVSQLRLEMKDKKVDIASVQRYGDDTDMDEEDHEAICNIFMTIESTIDKLPAKDFMEVCFTKIKKLSVEKTLLSQSRFMYKDLIDLRANNRVPRRKVKKAKTLNKIRNDVKREERLQAQQSA